MLSAMLSATIRALGLAACSTLAAQGTSRLHPLGNAGAFALATAGNFTGTLRSGVAFTVDGEVVVAIDPSLHSWFRATPARDTTGLTTLPSGDPFLADRILAIGRDGAVFLTITPDFAGFTATPILDGDWIRATQLVAERRGSGRCVFAGVAEVGDTFLIAAETMTGYATIATVSVGATILDLALVDWDHDGDSEVCALTAAGVHPYLLDGTPLPALLAPGSEQLAIERLLDPTGERLAWLTRTPASQTCLLAVVDASNADLPIVLPPAAFDLKANELLVLRGMASAQVGGDGYGDVVLTHAVSDFVCCVERTAPAGGASSPTVQMLGGDIEPTAALALAACPPLFGDFDHDGRTDLIAMSDAPAGMRVRSGFPIMALGVAASVLDASHTYTAMPGSHSLALKLLPGYLSGAAKLLVTTYFQPMRTSATMSYADTQTFDVSAGSTDFAVVLPNQVPVSIISTSPVDVIWPTSSAVRIEFRTVSASSQPGPTQAAVLVVHNLPAESFAALRPFLGDDGKRVYVRPTLVGGLGPRSLTPPPVD